MLTWSLPLLRRRGTGHVVKYLEGVPTPTRLIDHLAGADLHASAELPFFTTVPRYVDVQREQRLSRLYFHHVLYPAGGARLPYQAVVVRGGRAVRSSETHLLRVKKATSRMPHHAEQQQQPTAVVAPAARRQNPLAVPSSQLGPSSPASSSPAAAKVPVMTASTTVPTEDVPAAASWARVDPARRPYFSAGTPCSHEHRRSSHRPPEDTKRSARVVEDTTLAPLRGVLEHFWNEPKATRNSSSQDATSGLPSVSLSTTNEMAERVRQLLVSPAAGLLWMPASASLPNTAGTCEESKHASSRVSDSSERRFWTELMAHVQERVSAMTMHVGGGDGGEMKSHAAVRTCLYVQTRLPPSATVALPLAQVRDYVHDSKETAGDLSVHDDASEHVVCRLAGGLEPVVSFAVGRPLTPVATDGAAASPSDRAFAHVTCLTRLNICVTSAPLAKSPAVAAAKMSSVTHPMKEAVPHSRDNTSPSAEPWRLGGVGLDLMTTLHARTVAERHPAKPSAHTNGRLEALTENGTSNVKANADSAEAGRYVIGRTDAETYVLPQRELLLTLHVPTHTEEMCAAQNQERLRRQVRIGRASSAAMSAAWPTEQTRLTSSRRAEGQYANAMSANATGVHHTNAPLQATTTPLAASPSMPLLLSCTSYEVRALPGDVVYIPRGWGFDVQRIVGTATIGNGSCGRKEGRDADKVDFYDHRAVAAQKGTWSGRRPEAPSKSREPSDTESHVASTASVQLTSVEVDALCLNYQPYPELTEAQAAVYVAANYVHSGVDEFYERGGNSIYRSYQ
ncbi:mt-SAF8 [Leishmania donovani]|uniref:Hypothetical_protein_conserved n=1 Tax=Leishmania donovani TaxID=5661 RepID=A0A504XN26_LEIDO|nr:hypothetical protein CGC20_0525 [Leishmania donovani]CAJ1992904.1 mt-SAF8 [Leishmania donovani]VDZ48734.1 hypothetical_protein_conserved [Leishmania donovani]